MRFLIVPALTLLLSAPALAAGEGGPAPAQPGGFSGPGAQPAVDSEKETVVVHHLVVKGTMDEQVMKALHDKAADQNALLAAVKARIQEVT